MKVRTRMAPSPTGEFHIGSMRTLLYNYAFARKNDGDFVLRIEDTDKKREVEGGVERILDVIKDFGLEWDEGPEVGGPFEPYIQSDRLELYKKHAEELIEKNAAYRCFCTAERLDELRKQQQKAGMPVTKYDKRCLNLSEADIEQQLNSNTPFVIRLNVPHDKEVLFEDKVYGEVTINTNDLDDQVLVKSDGFPTYHLAVVVDDYLMNITHIMRGIEWLPSTPKHVLLYEAFGWNKPVYAHLPNLKEVGANKKMSKRYGDVHARAFLEKGYLPEALLNFLMLLGWNPGTEKEIYTVNEFIKDFSVERIHKSDLVAFDRDKLLWVNGQYIREKNTGDLFSLLKEWAGKYSVDLGLDGVADSKAEKVLGLVQERMKLLSEFPELTHYFFNKPLVNRELLISYANSEKAAGEILANFIKSYEQLSENEWKVDKLDTTSHEILEDFSYSPKEAFMTIRVAVSGKKATPQLFDMLDVLGKSEVLQRLESSLNIVNNNI